MASRTSDPTVVRISQKGQATIPKPLCEKFGIDTPGEVFIYEKEGRIIVEPIPSLEELGGIHATSDRDRGDVLKELRRLKADERVREATRGDRLRPTDAPEK